MAKSKSIIPKILKIAKPFAGLFFLTMFLNSIFSAIQAFSVAMINPLIKILFNLNGTVTPEKNQSISISSSYLSELFQKFKNVIFDFVQSDSGMIQSMINLGIFIMIIFIVKNFFKYLSGLTGTRLQESLIQYFRDLAFSKLTTLSIDFFKKNKEGKLISVLTNDIQTFNRNTILIFTHLLRDALQVIFFFFMLIMISPKLLLISISSGAVTLLVFNRAKKFLRKYALRMQNAMADYTSTMQESIGGIRIVKAYSSEKYTIGKFMSDTNRYFRAAMKNRKVTGIMPAITEIAAIAALCVVLFVGGSDVVYGKMNPEDLMTFLFALFATMSPANQFFTNMTNFQQGFVAAERVFSILETEPTITEGSDKINCFNSEIEIKNVSFGYEADQAAVNQVSFSIPKNKKIAFVGASGSGKSTMLDLIIRFYDPQNGSILIDGNDIKQYDSSEYRKLFGIVSQDNILFNDTIYNNIRYGDESISDQTIIESAKKANAFDFINSFPEKFNTQIGNRGTNLSGGERQRVAIARALARNPQILVFDEATSALDAESEKIVQEAINTSLAQKTAIIVAHRLSTIRDCDEILVFEKGKIIERGNHNELYNQGGQYRKLCDLQFTGSAE